LQRNSYIVRLVAVLLPPNNKNQDTAGYHDFFNVENPHHEMMRADKFNRNMALFRLLYLEPFHILILLLHQQIPLRSIPNVRYLMPLNRFTLPVGVCLSFPFICAFGVGASTFPPT